MLKTILKKEQTNTFLSISNITDKLHKVSDLLINVINKAILVAISRARLCLNQYQILIKTTKKYI